MRGPARNRRGAVRGLVLPVEWDARSRVRSVGIFSAAEQVYRVSMTGRGAELLQLLQQEVLARGILTQRRRGELSIQIDKYEVCPQDDGECWP